MSINNLHELHEQQSGAPPSKLSALVMAAFGGAGIVFAALVLMRSPAEANAETVDPLGELVARAGPVNSAPNTLGAGDVTFPSVLSDQPNATTAMELVRANKKLLAASNHDDTAVGQADGDPNLPPRHSVSHDGSMLNSMPPVAGERLAVVPLPAQDILESNRATVAHSDKLRKMATALAREREDAELAEAGHAGGYQLQVSSFKSTADADAFVMALRRRGHRAHHESAHVKGRGVWYRVRVGPFRYKRSAQVYRQDFEAKERMVTFIVEPPKQRIRVDLTE